MHRFIIMINGALQEYQDYNDIPIEFDHVIEFSPMVPSGPHTAEQHKEIEQWNIRLQNLMEIERAGSIKKR